ncbi:MAG TPA: hypothetical protein VLG15_04200 [Thermoanaerobaculia bacterium]|nr:hypothetical protein [Thermoanaerobaculia bacterium]
MNTRALPLPGLPRGRHNRRALRRTPPFDSAGMSFGRLFGVALLGWFGLMMLVTALAL